MKEPDMKYKSRTFSALLSIYYIFDVPDIDISETIINYAVPLIISYKEFHHYDFERHKKE